MEIVKQMQKLRGIDGDGQYGDSDSDSSNRLANRRTIHMLEKQRQKKKAIGTLDVAFKKRFFALNGQLAGQDGAPPEPGKIARKFIFTFCFMLFVLMPSQRKESGYPIRAFDSRPVTDNRILTPRLSVIEPMPDLTLRNTKQPRRPKQIGMPSAPGGNWVCTSPPVEPRNSLDPLQAIFSL